MTPPPLPSRTLRCANGALYLLMALSVAGCVAWGILSGRLSGLWQIGSSIAAALLALLWGGRYAALRWETGAQGICHRLLCFRKNYHWESLRSASLQENDTRGVATCCITLTFTEGELRLSSDLISLDDLELLRDDLIAAGLLPQTPQKTASNS